jgi:hypothetical protein
MKQQPIENFQQGFLEFNVRLPINVIAKIQPLAAASGLTTEQMVQSLLTLSLHSGGWFSEPPEQQVVHISTTQEQ